ncbi:MAG TPA: hypothetical protein VJC18_00050, partial [bacterium]|nr:hypothetical protein [bacterium]
MNQNDKWAKNAQRSLAERLGFVKRGYETAKQFNLIQYALFWHADCMLIRPVCGDICRRKHMRGYMRHNIIRAMVIVLLLLWVFSNNARAELSNLSRIDTGGNLNDIVIEGNYAYAIDFSTGLNIIDISDLTAPSLLGTYGYANPSGVAVSGNIAYGIGAYGTSLQILDVSDPANP